MTVATEIVPEGSVVANGSSNAFTIGFTATKPDLVVRRNRVATTAYSIVAGQIQFDAGPPASGVVVDWRRRTAATQASAFPNSNSVKPQAIEQAIDKLTLQTQELRGQAGRAVSAPIGEAGVELPKKSDRAGKLAIWNDAGDAMRTDRTLVQFDADVAATAANKATAVAAAASASSSASSADTSADQAAASQGAAAASATAAANSQANAANSASAAASSAEAAQTAETNAETAEANAETAQAAAEAAQAAAETARDVAVAATESKADKATTVTGAGLATGGGDLSANRVITVTAASQADAQTGTATAVVMTPERATDHFEARVSAFMRTVVDDADAGAARTTLSVYSKDETDAAIAALVDSSPSTLNTLNELAAALGDDPNYATTTAALIGTKQDAHANLAAIAGAAAPGATGLAVLASADAETGRATLSVPALATAARVAQLRTAAWLDPNQLYASGAEVSGWTDAWVSVAKAIKRIELSNYDPAVQYYIGGFYHDHATLLDRIQIRKDSDNSIVADTGSVSQTESTTGLTKVQFGTAPAVTMWIDYRELSALTGALVVSATSANRLRIVKSGESQLQSEREAVRNTLTINQGKNFPFKQMNRGGTTSVASIYWNNAILNAEVLNAEAGKYYQVAYFRNNASGSGDGWIIKEFDAATYEATGTETIVHTYTDAYPTLDRSAGVQWLDIELDERPGVTVRLLVDPSQFPAEGTFVNANSPNTTAAWSWIVDPLCYQYAEPPAVEPATVRAMIASVDVDAKTVSVVCPFSSTKMRRVSWGPNGYNDLFNHISVEEADLGDPQSATWTMISTGETDWVPPMVIESTTAPLNAAATSIYTGGNHGSSGGAGGSTTAAMTAWSVEIDGHALVAGETHYGPADRVVVRWANDLMAYNTWETYARYVLRQHLTAVFTPAAIEVWEESEALEALEIITHNGPQMTSDEFASVLYYGGAAPGTRYDIAVESDAGDKSAAPNAWAAVLYSATYGYQVSWVDRAYADGDGSNVHSAAPLIRRGSGSNDKIYHAIVASSPVVMADGDTLSWHGGYAWAPASMVDGLDSAFLYRDGAKEKLAWAFTAAGSGTIALPMRLTGAVAGTDRVGARGRLAVSAASADSDSVELT